MYCFIFFSFRKMFVGQWSSFYDLHRVEKLFYSWVVKCVEPTKKRDFGSTYTSRHPPGFHETSGHYSMWEVT